MTLDKKILNLERELRKVKTELNERNKDLQVYKSEITRLNTRVSKLLMNLDSDAELIKKVFRYLVPTQFPHISGIHFSTKFMAGMRFNGDYMDVFEHKDKFKFSLLMSSSKNANLTTLLIAFLMKYGRSSDEDLLSQPDQFIKKIWGELKEREGEVSDIDVGYVFVDKKSYKLNFKKDGNICCFYQESDTNGAVVDLSKEQVAHQDKIISRTMKPYDRLVMVSPGLVEAPNSKGEFFSEYPILESMSKISLSAPAHDLRNEIMFRLSEHLEGRKPLQDVSLIIMSIGSNVIKLV